MNKTLFNNAAFIFKALEDNGYECYAVGGFVRDYLLNIKANDIDFTTNATPDEILSVFKDYNTIEIGKKYGTICVISKGKVYEITTYRIDGDYSDSRHPDAVNFSKKLQDDLSRRDFTINAMAMDKDGNIIDPYNGTNDLNNKLIRTVGNPIKRFSEDAIRIIRTLRFKGKLGFNIESKTSNACHALSVNLKKVHPQRIRDELSGILIADTFSDVLSEYRDVFIELIPELKNTINFEQNTPHHRYDVFTHTVKALSFSPKSLESRLAVLFHDIGKPLCHVKDKAGLDHFKGHPKESARIAKEILLRYNFPSETAKKVYLLIRYHDARFKNLKPDIKRVLSETGESCFYDLLNIQKCDILGQSEYKRAEKLEHLNKVKQAVDEIIRNSECYNIKTLAINGNDIVNLGVSGKKVGETLSFLLQKVIDDKLENSYNTLINAAKAHLKGTLTN